MSAEREARELVGSVVLGAGLSDEVQREIELVLAAIRVRVTEALAERDARLREVMARIDQLNSVLHGAQRIMEKIREYQS